MKADLDGAVIKQQISIIENGVNISSKRYNELKATNSALISALKIKLDQLKEEKKNYEDMDALLKVRTSISKFVVCYQKRCDVTMTMCY